jgi:hypothetical protein
LNNQNTKENEKQAKTHQCYSSEPVYSPQDKLLQREFFFNKNEGEKHQKAVFSPQHFTVIKKWGPCCSTKKGQSSKNNFDNNAKTILEKLIAFDFNEQTQRTVKDQNIWRQFLQSPQTLQWAHLGRAS